MSELGLFVDDRVSAIEELHTATAIYTREPIVRGLLERVGWPEGDRRLLDPSCGDGAFMAAATDMLLSNRPDVPESELLARVHGWEIHAGACAQARARVRDVLTAHGRNITLADDMITNGDFLTERKGDERFDIIIGNPPYLRFCNVPALLRAEYENALPDWAKNDLLHSFLQRCSEALTDDGVVACVTADRWLFNVSCARLREMLGRHLRLAHVSRLDPSTAFYRPKSRRQGTPPRIHPVEVVLHPQRGRTIDSNPIYPEADSHTSGTPLSQIARVTIAPWVGKVGAFVVDESTAATLRAHGATLVPAIDTDDLLDDGTVGQPTRYVIFTTDDAPIACIQDHLARTRHLLPERAKQRKTWWLPPERVDTIDLSQPLLVVPRIARELRTHVVPAGILPINHNLSIIPNGKLDTMTLRTLLDTEDARTWIRERAARLENGYLSITTKLLRELPIEHP